MRGRPFPISLLVGLALLLGNGLALALDFEVVHEFGRDHPPGNVAMGPDGRIFMSQHQFWGAGVRVVEVLPDGGTRPYPDARWAAAPGPDGVGLRGVLGLRVDEQGVLWMLDGAAGDAAGRLIAWDTRAERLHRVIYLAQPVIPANAFLNDLAVDLKNQAVYIADPAGGANAALIVVDLATGRARRLLEGSVFTAPEEVNMLINGRLMKLGDNPARVGINPITVDPANEWVYFGPMSGMSLYRVATTDLLDESLTPEQLAERVQRYGDKPICDGITVDGAGNVYITDVVNNAIGVVEPDGSYRTLMEDPVKMSWPDGFAFGPDDHIYVVTNQLHSSPVLNGGEDGFEESFFMLRFPSIAGGAVGR